MSCNVMSWTNDNAHAFKVDNNADILMFRIFAHLNYVRISNLPNPTKPITYFIFMTI